MKSIAKLYLVSTLLLPLTACNTVQGAGKDLQEAGTWVVDSVNNARGHTKPRPAPKGKYQYPGEGRPSHIKMR